MTTVDFTREEIEDLRLRTRKAEARLLSKARHPHTTLTDAQRLFDKAEGVRLVLSYMWMNYSVQPLRKQRPIS